MAALSWGALPARSLPHPPCAVFRLRGETREVMAEPPEAAEGFRWRTQQGGSRWGERGWRRQRATMNNKFDAWVSPPAPLDRPRCRACMAPSPPAPPAAAPAPGGRDAMSHGATHSTVPAAGARPGPEGTRGREVWAVGWWQSRTGESRGASWPRLSLAFSGPLQGMGRAERHVGCWVLARCLLARDAACALLGGVGSGVGKSQQRYSDRSSCGLPE